jgi:hypothetical protein
MSDDEVKRRLYFRLASARGVQDTESIREPVFNTDRQASVLPTRKPGRGLSYLEIVERGNHLVSDAPLTTKKRYTKRQGIHLIKRKLHIKDAARQHNIGEQSLSGNNWSQPTANGSGGISRGSAKEDNGREKSDLKACCHSSSG